MMNDYNDTPVPAHTFKTDNVIEFEPSFEYPFVIYFHIFRVVMVDISQRERERGTLYERPP